MKKIVLPSLFLFLIFACACEGEKGTLTTFILIRHAEKGDDGTDDPDLKAEGEARAKRLAFMLKDTPLSAIYSTHFKRTINTVKPISEIKNIDVQPYDAHKPEVIEKMVQQHRGGTVLMSGHSNNIPWTANLLLGENAYEDYPETEYGILLIVTVADMGRVTGVTRLNY